MSAAVDHVLKSSSPSLVGRLCSSPPVALCAPSSLQLRSLLRHRGCRVSLLSGNFVPSVGLGAGPSLIDPRFLSYRSAVAFAAPREESDQRDLEIQEGKDLTGPDGGETLEAWKQVLANFREQVLKMQSVSQEAYKVNSAKAMAILKENSEQLKIQAEKAREELSAMAKDIGEEGRVYISTAAENTPESVKEIVETFSSSADDLSDISKFHDYHVGIPYGLLLSVGGFLSFMLTGSTSAIRFGIILGGALLALSASSLRSQKKGETYLLPVKGQAAIVAIIFMREISLLSQRPGLFSFANTTISGAVLAFYIYRIAVDRMKKKGTDLEESTENRFI